jgi:steroid delta-isomerase-like uncharacterized protein
VSIEQNKETVRRLYESITYGKVDDLDRYVSQDFVDNNPFPGQSPGLQGVKDSFKRFLGSFSDVRMEIEDLIAEGDKVVSRTVVHGRHTGEFNGIPATGKEVSLPVIDIFGFSGGKVAEHWGLSDNDSLLGQLGVNVDPSELGKRAA